MSVINKYFDNVYVLNVDSRSDRMSSMIKRLQYFDIKYERFNALTGTVVKYIFDNTTFPVTPSVFEKWPSSNTLACNLSHLSIYNQALQRGESRILILEDDIRIHREIDNILTQRLTFIEEYIKQWDLLYLCYIPVTPDGQFWDFSILDSSFIPHPESKAYSGVFKSHNLWSLMGYAISTSLMSHLLEVYSSSFPMEIDRYLVKSIQGQSEFTCLGISPTLISGENLGSDNQPFHQFTDFMVRTVDTRFSKYWDYV